MVLSIKKYECLDLSSIISYHMFFEQTLGLIVYMFFKKYRQNPINLEKILP